jgi:nucleotide-binding universal stress UspA family protein
MRKILVPCDFSRPAVNAFRFALSVADQANAEIHLVHVIQLPVLADTLLMPTLNFEADMINELKQKAIAQFKALIEKYNQTNINCYYKIVFGVTSFEILARIKDDAIDLVIMGSHGVNGFREVLIGSTTEKIIRRSAVPVVAIKNYFNGQIKNIVFPISSDIDDKNSLIERVKKLQHFFKATLHIVWINTPTNFASDTETRTRQKEFIKKYNITDYTLNVFNHYNEEGGILAFSKSIKGDLIAMGTHGRTGIAHIVNGSMTEDLANHTDTLIWTYSVKNDLVEV